MLKYTEDHEWLKQDGDEVIVGITAHASEQLGDVVFIELPEVGPRGQRRRGNRGDRVGQGRLGYRGAGRRRHHRRERGAADSPVR